MSEPAPLRRGWTTGACAAAAARAAATALLAGRFPDPVTVHLPGGQAPAFPLALRERGEGWARAGVVKDAGDDPDVTHGALIVSELRRGAPGSGITYRAGEGVGTVTRPGLALAVGEPAINPGPRQIIAAALAAAALETGHGTALDLEVTVAIPGGAALAEKTMNARLGILGGLSILGTTGVVIPYSCSSWIHAIHRGVDVARAAGVTHVAGATGRTSEQAVQRLLHLPDVALIDMGDFVGALLKYLRRHPVERLTLAGGFGKLAKLAQGALDLHSARSRLDGEALARLLEDLQLSPAAAARARAGAGAGEALAVLPAAERPLLVRAVAERAREVALATLAGGTAIDVMIFDREGRLLGHAGD
ncbi:MAG TPA: cobalt-precorrin-5B (C(1))-methyltransferase [Stellaceae bacterium]|nr:cobalt-precorrin-5B (C(1))-methyltransferase [Stellaceae bacterium]